MFYTRFTLHRRACLHPVVKAVEMMYEKDLNSNMQMFKNKKIRALLLGFFFTKCFIFKAGFLFQYRIADAFLEADKSLTFPPNEKDKKKYNCFDFL